MNDSGNPSHAYGTSSVRRSAQPCRPISALVSLAILGASFFAPSTFAQTRVVLNVEVRDQTGAVIPGAKVSLIEMPENPSVTAITDSDGNVSIHLPPGSYELSASMQGFKTATKQVVVNDTDHQTIAIMLRVGGCPDPDPCPVIPEPAVPDEANAVKLAEEALTKVYGKKKTLSERPFAATLSGDVWHVQGTLWCKDKQGNLIKAGCSGRVAMAEIRKSDGRILKTSETKSQR